MFVILTFLTSKFRFHFYMLVLYSVFRRNKLVSSIIDQIGKTMLTAELLTVTNTLILEPNKMYLFGHLFLFYLAYFPDTIYS